MSRGGEDGFQVRPGRIRSRGSGGRAKSFLSRMARSMSKAGGPRGKGGAGRPGRLQSSGQRRAIVKARIIRMAASSAGALRAHLSYLKRDSVERDREQGCLFNADEDDLDGKAFAARAAKDRHHFRFIVSPEDGRDMANLKPFVRDLVSQMETDLETRLDWVAAVHDDTAHPHAHIVVRGCQEDGRDLVMPRAYIAHGIRERAADLITLELGPETALEAQQKLARETGAERLTRIDRFLVRQAGDERQVSLSDSPPAWRSVHAARLKTLERLKLAEKTGRGTWQLVDGMERTLQNLGERGDIIKAMNRALADREGRRFDAGSILDRSDPDGRTVTGAVLAKGMRGEGHDRPYVIVDGLEGQAVYAEINDPAAIDELRRGMIVSVGPADARLKPADRTIAQIAGANDGVYSAGLHQAADPKSTPEFIAAHVRRLEALRRAGHVERQDDGTWQVPGDYLKRAERYQRARAMRQPLQLAVASRLALDGQAHAVGVTWLDDAQAHAEHGFGFGRQVAEATRQRKAFLVEIGIIDTPDAELGSAEKARLRQMDLDAAGRDLSAELGKSYARAPTSGEIQGVYRQAVDRPSGRFAVIDRGRDFTLVPWRDVMERNRGLMVTGRIGRNSISWTLTRAPGIGR